MTHDLPNASEIAADVQAGRRSARSIIEQCLAVVDRRDGRLNAMAVRMDQQALATADRLDERIRRGEEAGPLAGVPFTVKECYHVAGSVSSLGCEHANKKFAETNPLIRRALAADAILLGKTNLSQLMLLYETDNPRYGRTNHPDFDNRSPGGSGGGDAAALAAGYACFALGTDMGGSTRQPAHSCGLAGFVPTPGFLEVDGVEPILPGATPLALLPGVLGSTTENVTLATKSLLPFETLPCQAPPSEMRVGYFESDDFFPACPTIVRAIRESVTQLEQMGVHVERMTPPSMERVLHLYCGMFGADGGERIRRQLRGENVDQRIKPLLRMGPLPRLARRALGRLVGWLGDPHTAGILRNSFRCSASALWSMNDQMCQLRKEFVEAMDSRRFDAVLGPPHATVAFLHGQSHWMLPAACYSMLPNVMGMPAGAAHVTTVTKDEESTSAMPLPERFQKTRCAKIAADNLKHAAGLPCGVQVMARPWADATVLKVMRMIEAGRGGRSEVDADNRESIVADRQS